MVRNTIKTIIAIDKPLPNHELDCRERHLSGDRRHFCGSRNQMKALRSGMARSFHDPVQVGDDFLARAGAFWEGS